MKTTGKKAVKKGRWIDLPFGADAVKILLPLLQMKNSVSFDKDRLEFVIDRLSKHFPPVDKRLILDIRHHASEAGEYIVETVEILRKMILIATVKDISPDQDIDDMGDMKEFSRDFILPAVTTKNHVTHVEWYGKGLTIFGLEPDFPEPKTWKEALSIAFRSSAVLDIARAFSVNPTLGYAETSLFFAGCPTCRKVFEKKRKDQVFCSVHCRGLAGVRRQRGRQRT